MHQSCYLKISNIAFEARVVQEKRLSEWRVLQDCETCWTEAAFMTHGQP